MRQVRLKNYEGHQIFVFQHQALFQYWFTHNEQLFMQWGEHQPSWFRRIASRFGQPLFPEGELQAIADSYEEHAIRSLDNILDPTAKHCKHNVKVAGVNPALCARCNQSGDRI